MKVNDLGDVIITYPQDVEEDTTDMRVIVNKFAKNQRKRTLDEALVFRDTAKDDILRILNQEKSTLENLESIEKKVQQRLPENFRDETRLIKLKDQIDYIQTRKDSVVSGETFGNLLLMQCGRFIQYAKITEDSSKSLWNKMGNIVPERMKKQKPKINEIDEKKMFLE